MLQSLTATLDLLPTNSKLIRGIPEVELKLKLNLKLRLKIEINCLDKRQLSSLSGARRCTACNDLIFSGKTLNPLILRASKLAAEAWFRAVRTKALVTGFLIQDGIKIFLGTFYCFIFSARNHVDFSDGSIYLELANQGLRRRQTTRPQIVTILTGNRVKRILYSEIIPSWDNILHFRHQKVGNFWSYLLEMSRPHLLLRGPSIKYDVTTLARTIWRHWWYWYWYWTYWRYWQRPFEDIPCDCAAQQDLTNQFSPQKPRMPREMRKKVLPS